LSGKNYKNTVIKKKSKLKNTKRNSLISICTAILFIFGTGARCIGQPTLTIAAASDVKPALDSVISVFTKKFPGSDIRTIYGSSGKLFEQISNDAPYDIFFSADINYPSKLKEKSIAISEVKSFGLGRIVLWSKNIDPSIDKMNCLLNKSIHKISIANPLHAPYGKRAEEAMKYFGVYDKIKSKLVFGENVSQAAQFVSSGAAEVGIVAQSLALSPNMLKEGGKYWLIPQESHQKLIQGYVILKHAQGNEFATKFADFIESQEAKKILKHFGFN